MVHSYNGKHNVTVFDDYLIIIYVNKLILEYKMKKVPKTIFL